MAFPVKYIIYHTTYHQTVLTDTVIIHHHSVTRPVIDPFLIATTTNSQVNKGNQLFLKTYCKPITNKEKQQENYQAVKIINPQKEITSSKYYFERNYDWLIGVIVLLVLLVVWVKIFYGNVIVRIFKSTINQQLARKLIDEKSNLLQKANTFLTILYIIGSGLFLFELISFYHFKIFNLQGFTLFVICTVFVFLFFVIKYFLYWFTGVLVNSEKEVIEFLSNGNIFYRSVGIILLPVVFSIPYIPDKVAVILLYCGITVFALSFILRVIRGFIVSFQFKLSLYYSFLYFCAIEILPIMYIYYFITILR